LKQPWDIIFSIPCHLRARTMHRTLFKSLFHAHRPTSRDATSSLYSGARNKGFVGFLADVDRAQFLAASTSLVADQASLRLRVGIPARQLMRFAPVCLLSLDLVEQDPALESLGLPRAIIVGKFPVRRIASEPARFSALLDWIAGARNRFFVAADLSDDLAAAANMYQVPWLAEFQRRLAHTCPLTVPSAALRERIGGGAAHGVTVIEDPYEREIAAAPAFAPRDVLRIAWFGVFGPPLRAVVEQQFLSIARRLCPRPVEIAFVTAQIQADLVGQMAAQLRKVNPLCALKFLPWSREMVEREVTAADLVVLPQESSSEWGRVKSHNRVVEALRGGRFPIVSPIPSYQELAHVAWVGEDLAAGVEWAMSHPSEVVDRIAAGQALVEERFSPHLIGNRWAALLGLTPA
jgi:glycosyltransferase involved in cell wall biosynthesis